MVTVVAWTKSRSSSGSGCWTRGWLGENQK